MAVDIGTVVKLMVLDTLSGRSPLYRLEMFAKSIDTGQNLSVVDQLLWPGTAVLRLLKRGLLNKEIANELNIATKTVEFHVTNILRKLQCSDRIELIDEEKLVTFINYSNNYTHTSGNITTNCICS
ncbi:MAG: response regulator transcription factor [Actinobacteria bacterium]|nr:response regulator transcription factor [Actinomycetota bacterium]